MHLPFSSSPLLYISISSCPSMRYRMSLLSSPFPPEFNALSFMFVVCYLRAIAATSTGTVLPPFHVSCCPFRSSIEALDLRPLPSRRSSSLLPIYLFASLPFSFSCLVFFDLRWSTYIIPLLVLATYRSVIAPGSQTSDGQGTSHHFERTWTVGAGLALLGLPPRPTHQFECLLHHSSSCSLCSSDSITLAA